jgi:hypothetical protein
MLVGGNPGANGNPAAAQDPLETIIRLSDRLKNATILEDRRAALYSLRGLSRDYKKVHFDIYATHVANWSGSRTLFWLNLIKLFEVCLCPDEKSY